MSPKYLPDLWNELFTGVSLNTAQYPRINLYKLEDGSLRIAVALAGYDKDDIEVKFNHQTRTLTIAADASEESFPELGEDSKVEILHHGISARSFARKFLVPTGLVVARVSMDNHVLSVFLDKEKVSDRHDEIFDIE